MNFKPTLAVNADFSKIVYPVYASPKLDGIRCSIVEGKALTRTLKRLPNAYLDKTLSVSALDGLDGELIVGDPCAKDVYTKTVSHVMSHEGKEGAEVTYYLFDYHDMDAATYRHRLDALTLRVEELKRWSLVVRLEVLEQELLHDEKDLLAYEADCVAEGYEGVILRSPNAPYKYGRSTVNEGYLLKVKRLEDSEAEIIGIEEEMHNGNTAETNELGRTKRSSAKAGKTGKGTMGALIMRDVVSGVEFNIGTGFTAAQRAAEWKIGTVHKYKFFPVGVKDKPRHPVYLGPRPEGA